MEYILILNYFSFWKKFFFKGLDMLANNNQWQECLELSSRQGGEILLRYMIRYAKLTMESGKFGDTIQAFAQFGMQPIP
jgi:hypothetical protein